MTNSNVQIDDYISDENDFATKKCSPAYINDVFFSCSDMYNSSVKNTCPRCGQIVYPFEKIGPIKDQLYHKVCFKCIVCGRQLDLRSYFINNVDLNDKQIYCQSHFPKSRKGHVNSDNFHIRNIMQAPKPSVMQHLNLPKPSVDGMSVGIQHAVNAQNLLHGDKPYRGGHHFPVLPPELVTARKQICELQKDIEIKQKEEEDALFKKFIEERKREEERIEKELDNEWTNDLQELCNKYENIVATKPEAKSKFQEEKKYLENNLTLKRLEKRRSIKQILLEQVRNETMELVTKQSKEMLTLMERKQIDIMKRQGIPVTFKTPPPPLPPKKKKVDLYPNVETLQYVDEVAIQVAKKEQSSYTELVEQLTGCFLTDLEKARAIFRWITVKNLNIMEFKDNISDDSPLWLLRGIKYGTETYHTLFMRLCSYAGLHCVNVKGHSKSFGYEPGLPINCGQFLNTWNAVLIEDEWRFVQCNWAARHLVMCKDSIDLNEGTNLHDCNGTDQGYVDKIEYEYDEHYFCTDPEEFIYEFFPFDPAWQLLSKALTLNEFEKLPFVRSLFFHYSLQFVNQNSAVITTNECGACEVQLKMPTLLKQNLVFHSQLRMLSASKDTSKIHSNGMSKITRANTVELDHIDNVKLENFVLHTVNGDEVSFNIHLPKRGIYYLELFANMVNKNISIFGQTFKLRCVCKYRIVCETLKQRMHALPECANGEWGPNKAFRYYNWKIISHFGAIIETIYDDVWILFQLPKMLKIHCKINSSNRSAICPPVTAQISTDFILSIHVQLLTNGQYGLDVYAFDPDSGVKVMSHCCKYLINRSDSFTHLLIGPSKFVGTIKEHFMPISHINPDIDVPLDQKHLKMYFKISQYYKFQFNLRFEGDTSKFGLPLKDYISVNRKENNVSTKLQLPYAGRYIFTISIEINPDKALTPVYGYSIKQRAQFR